MRVMFIFFLAFSATFAIGAIRPLPQKIDVDLAKAKLGRTLFSETLLSSDRSTACASCHDFNHGGADPRPVSLGVGNREGNIQSPTVYNARFNFKQFWNGRADSLREQAEGPIHNPAEMDLNEMVIEKRLNGRDDYKKAFKSVYGTKSIRYEQVIDAIVEFENALVTPNSKFDRYLRSETQLSEAEQEGYKRFKKLGCITCHNGINIGGNSFQKIGIFKPYAFDPAIPDLHALTKQEEHKNVFKVPTLRNISQTAPYFHDGKAATLRDAIRTMSYHNLGITLDEESADLLVRFLRTLDGERPAILDLP
jgi:cytochrome c peroxidase